MMLKQYPFYIKASVTLVGIIAFIFILNVLGSILVPFAFAALIAILLNPLNTRLERRLPRVVAIFVSLIIAVTLVSVVLFFLSTQIAKFSAQLPLLQAKFTMLLGHLQQWLSAHFGVSIERQIAMAKEAAQGNKQIVGQTIGTVFGMLSVLVLIPVYVFLLLFYKPLILDFLFRVFAEKNAESVGDILGQTKSAIQSYVIGLLIETTIVATLNSIALLILGVENAILIGVIGGILNMLPYIGGLVAIALPVLMALATKDGYTIELGIIGAYMLIQLIDNNVLVPRIVASKVQINALMSIIVVLMGGALWGIAGMFLSIPFIAVLKIIFDRIEGLKPWGLLLGDKVPAVHSGNRWQEKLRRVGLISKRARPLGDAEDGTRNKV